MSIKKKLRGRAMSRDVEAPSEAVVESEWCQRCGAAPAPNVAGPRVFCNSCWEHTIVPAVKYHQSKHGGAFDEVAVRLFPVRRVSG